jgi:hypothetical protein
MINLGPVDDEGFTPRCSRAACTATATTTVNWRNPKIHTTDRIKVWLACDEHKEFLRDFLEARNFPVVLAPFGTPVTDLSTAPGSR